MSLKQKTTDNGQQTMDKLERPSPWLIGPVATAFLLFSTASQDYIVMPLCFLIILATYYHRLTIDGPDWKRWRSLRVRFIIASVLSLTYYLTVLSGKISLYTFGPSSFTVGGILTMLTLVWTWHLPGKAVRKTGPILGFTGFLALSSTDLFSYPPLYLPMLLLFFTTTLLALAHLGGGLRIGYGLATTHVLRRIFLVAGCFTVIGMGTWLGTDRMRLLGNISLSLDFLHLPNYSGIRGAGGIMRLERYIQVVISQEIVATLSGSTPPGYLRTHVMTEYRDEHWRPYQSVAKPIHPILEESGGYIKRFDLPQRQVPNSLLLEQRRVNLLVNLRGAVLLPYSTRSVKTSDPISFLLAEGGILQYLPGEWLGSYEIVTESTKERSFPSDFILPLASSPQEVEQAREAPKKVLASLRPLAREIVGEKITQPLEAARMIQKYFQDNYEYSLEVNLASEGDPTVDFILNRRPAYCEYYASAMALMLRSLEIPARVVGGFAVKEYNPIVGEWIIRQRDAHAWTEVFDVDTKQWVVFDATPPSVTELLPQGGMFAWLGQCLDWIKLRIKELLTRLSAINLREWFVKLSEDLVNILRGPAGLAVLAVGVTLGLGMKYRHSLLGMLIMLWQAGKARSRGSKTSINSFSEEVTRIFERVILALEKQGLPIGHSETVEEYLRRLGIADPLLRLKIAQFFRTYIDLRFRSREADGMGMVSTPTNLDQLITLRHMADQIVERLHK